MIISSSPDERQRHPGSFSGPACRFRSCGLHSVSGVARMSESDIRGFFRSRISHSLMRATYLMRPTICGGTDLPVVSSPLAKNISLFRLVETAIEPIPSRAHQEGRYASSRTWSAGCDGREVAPQDERGYPRTAKPRGSGASTLASSSWTNSRTTVARKPDHREERGVSRNTIAQGMPECSANLW